MLTGIPQTRLNVPVLRNARPATPPQDSVKVPDRVEISSGAQEKRSPLRVAVSELLFWTRKLGLSLASPIAGLFGVGLGVSPARLTGAQSLHQKGIDGTGTRVAILDQGFTKFGAGDEDVLGVYETRSGQFQQGLKESTSDPIHEHVTRQKGISFHGNAMASIVTGEGLGLTGMAPGAEVIGISIVDEEKRLQPDLFLKGLQWVQENHREQNIKAVSASVNFWRPTDEQRELAAQVIKNLADEGVAVVVATGNRGPKAGSISFPADVPGVIGVGAYTPGLLPSSYDDRLERYSSRGGEGKPSPSLLAPGGDIFTKDNHGLVELTKGTSNAAPMVAGAIALLSQAYPEASLGQKVDALLSTAEPIYGDSQAEGRGALRLGEAFEKLA